MQGVILSAGSSRSLILGANGATDLEGSARAVKDFVSDATQAVGDLERALRAGSDTPAIGGALGDFARRADRFESVLSGLSDLLGGFESEFDALGKDLRDASDSADNIFQADMNRWLADPYDAEWPPADPSASIGALDERRYSLKE